jgi:hypothetical protein
MRKSPALTDSAAPVYGILVAVGELEVRTDNAVSALLLTSANFSAVTKRWLARTVIGDAAPVVVTCAPTGSAVTVYEAPGVKYTPSNVSTLYWRWMKFVAMHYLIIS